MLVLRRQRIEMDEVVMPNSQTQALRHYLAGEGFQVTYRKGGPVYSRYVFMTVHLRRSGNYMTFGKPANNLSWTPMANKCIHGGTKAVGCESVCRATRPRVRFLVRTNHFLSRQRRSQRTNLSRWNVRSTSRTDTMPLKRLGFCPTHSRRCSKVATLYYFDH